jgi:group I intron endonuclease
VLILNIINPWDVPFMVIYLISNLVDNQIYIGATRKKPLARFKAHLSKARSKSSKSYPLIELIRKYGEDNFRVNVLRKGIKSLEELGDLEEYYIKKFKPSLNGRGARYPRKYKYSEVLAYLKSDLDDYEVSPSPVLPITAPQSVL